MSGSMPKEVRNEGLKELSRCNIERTARKGEFQLWHSPFLFMY